MIFAHLSTEDQKLLLKSRDTFVLAFDRLYRSRNEPVARIVLAQIQERLNELTAYIGDPQDWVYGGDPTAAGS